MSKLGRFKKLIVFPLALALMVVPAAFLAACGGISDADRDRYVQDGIIIGQEEGRQQEREYRETNGRPVMVRPHEENFGGTDWPTSIAFEGDLYEELFGSELMVVRYDAVNSEVALVDVIVENELTDELETNENVTVKGDTSVFGYTDVRVEYRNVGFDHAMFVDHDAWLDELVMVEPANWDEDEYGVFNGFTIEIHQNAVISTPTGDRAITVADLLAGRVGTLGQEIMFQATYVDEDGDEFAIENMPFSQLTAVYPGSNNPRTLDIDLDATTVQTFEFQFMRACPQGSGYATTGETLTVIVRPVETREMDTVQLTARATSFGFELPNGFDIEDESRGLMVSVNGGANVAVEDIYVMSDEFLREMEYIIARGRHFVIEDEGTFTLVIVGISIGDTATVTMETFATDAELADLEIAPLRFVAIPPSPELIDGDRVAQSASGVNAMARWGRFIGSVEDGEVTVRLGWGAADPDDYPDSPSAIRIDFSELVGNRTVTSVMINDEEVEILATTVTTTPVREETFFQVAGNNAGMLQVCETAFDDDGIAHIVIRFGANCHGYQLTLVLEDDIA